MNKKSEVESSKIYYLYSTWIVLNKYFQKQPPEITRKDLCQGLFFDKVAGRPATLLKKNLCHSCFPFVIRTPFLQNISKRMLLYLAVTILLNLQIMIKNPKMNSNTFDQLNLVTKNSLSWIKYLSWYNNPISTNLISYQDRTAKQSETD